VEDYNAITFLRINQLKSNIVICNECERDVDFVSGKFVNQIVELDDDKIRKMRNQIFLKGGYIFVANTRKKCNDLT